MANQNILTYNAKVAQVEQAYYAPVAFIQGTQIPISTLYVFLSRVDSWPVDANTNLEIIPAPTEDQAYIKQVFKNMFVAKQVGTTNISPVIQRIDWTANTVYGYYQDNVDMFARDANSYLINNFYIKNRYDQVFKCLWNNNGQASTKEPFFQPGTYGTNNIYQDSDGYKWKYMYTIDVGSKTKFMDSSWMPVLVGANTPNPLQSTAGCGDIEVINVINGGNNYSNTDATLTAIVTGDGVGAGPGSVVVNATGQITDILIPSGLSGSNYSYANVTIQTSANGSGALAIAPISPVGGHSFDPISELGSKNVMITCEFNGSEGGIIPTDIEYRQTGLLINPYSISSLLNGTTANGSIYKTSTNAIVTTGTGTYLNDELVYQGSSLSTASFVGTVLHWDSANSSLDLINTQGTIVPNSPIFGDTSATVRTLLSSNQGQIDWVPFSGYMAYIENRAGVQRSDDGIEQFKFVLGY